MNKKIYEAPHMSVELFTANQAVSACTVCGGIDYTFDCMKGPNTDTTNCIASVANVFSGCKTNVGYADGAKQAVDQSSSGSHSNNNRSIASWSTVSYNERNCLSVTYSGKIDGLLYTDSDSAGTTPWSVDSNNIVVHSTSSGGTHHQVAPVINSQSVKASW